MTVVNRLPLPESPPSAPAALRFGRVVAPPVDHRDIPPELNTAWDALGSRRPRFVVLHRMAGTLAGTDTYFRTNARRTARTDYGIDHQSGEIWRWTDPLGPHSPYASGPWTAPPGDGLALVRRLGVDAINRDGVSVEIAGFEGDPVSDVAFERLAHLIAFWADWAEVPHTAWPINPETGLTFTYWHCEFNGAKSCPGDVVKGLTSRLIRRAGEILRAAQTGDGADVPTPRPTVPVPPDDAPPPILALPAGGDLALVQGWFGSVRAGTDRARTFAFDPDGPVSALWLARGRATGEWPQLAAVTIAGDGSRLFRFDGGWTVRGRPDGTAEEVAA